MTIRYECEQCGSTLKIKDDLAGKPGKCPKCKTAFTIPASAEDSGGLSDSEPEIAAPDITASKITVPKAAVRKPAANSDDDFDVDAFLMDTGTKSKPKSKAASDFNEDDFLSDEPAGKVPGKPSKFGSQDSEDDDEVFQIRRPDGGDSKNAKRAPGIEEDSKTPASSSRRASGMSSAGTAANIASDLLAKTGKKGKKTAWNQVEPESKESEYDYTDLKNYLFKTVAPMLLGGIIGIPLLYYGMAYVMGGKSNLPDLGKVTGTVTLGGKPVSSVLVWFHPIRSQAELADKKKRVSSSSGMTDESGHYELSYLADVKGAVIGECRVQIEAPSRSDISAQWLGSKSDQIRKVEAGRKVIDLELLAK